MKCNLRILIIFANDVFVFACFFFVLLFNILLIYTFWWFTGYWSVRAWQKESIFYWNNVRMVNSGQKRPSSKSCDEINITHWYQTVKKIVFQTFRNNNPCIVLSGGSDHGKLIYILEVSPEVKYSSDQICENNDVVLKIQEQKISGFTYLDAVNFLQYCFKNSNSVTIECVPSGESQKVLLVFILALIWISVTVKR